MKVQCKKINQLIYNNLHCVYDLHERNSHKRSVNNVILKFTYNVRTPSSLGIERTVVFEQRKFTR